MRDHQNRQSSEGKQDCDDAMRYPIIAVHSGLIKSICWQRLSIFFRLRSLHQHHTHSIMKFSTIFSASAVVVAALTNLVSADTIFIQELQSPAGDRHSVGILDIGTGDKSLGENIGLVWFDNDLAVPNTGGGTPMGTQTGHCVEVWVGKNLACYFNFKLDTPDGLQGNILAEALFDLENFPDAELVITGGSGDFLGIVGTGVTSAPADFDGTTFFYTFDYDFVPIKGGGNRQLRGDAV